MVSTSSANGAWAKTPPSLRQKLRSTLASSRFKLSSSLIAILLVNGHGSGRSQGPSTSGQSIHLAGELDVELGDAAGVVGGQGHLDVLVDVEPLGVVIHLFGDQSGSGHEPEGLVEILEYELPGDGVPPRYLTPAAELPERVSFRRSGQFLSHFQALSS